jgi:hypothetical protein
MSTRAATLSYAAVFWAMDQTPSAITDKSVLLASAYAEVAS